MTTAMLEEKTANPELEAISAMKAVQERFEERTGTIRRIMHICGPFYRVTFVDRTTGFVPASYFVKVKDGTVLEVK